MIGLSLSSISEHNMWSCCLLTDDNDNSIIIRPHIVFTDGRQQRQPNHNTTTYYRYWRTTTTINPIIILPHCMFTDNMWSCYDWVVVVVFRLLTQHVVILSLGCRCLPSVNTICGRVMSGLILYLLTDDNNDNPIIIRPHIMFTDRRQQRQSNDNTTTYCVYWRTICGRVMIGLSLLSSVSKHNMWWYYDWVVVVFRQ
jgi:hypothetical protein